MKSWILVFGILICSVCNGLSQNNQTSSSSSSSSSSSQSSSGGGQMTMQDQKQINSRFDNLRAVELQQNAGKPMQRILDEEIRPLYRKPNKKELANLTPSQSLLTQYEKFLKQPDTGIFKLSADSTCAANAQVVVATETCLSNNIPGAGTAYSFRVESHRMLHLSDLVLEKDVIRTGSLMQQGLLVNLGNIELDQISLQTPGLKYLLEFNPSMKQEEIQTFEEKLSKGIKADGFIYGYGLYVENQKTFALRSIAYRGKFQRAVSGVTYNEMEFDKRKDIVVVFRIVEKDANGDLTILWRELQTKDSPKIELTKEQQ